MHDYFNTESQFWHKSLPSGSSCIEIAKNCETTKSFILKWQKNTQPNFYQIRPYVFTLNRTFTKLLITCWKGDVWRFRGKNSDFWWHSLKFSGITKGLPTLIYSAGITLATSLSRGIWVKTTSRKRFSSNDPSGGVREYLIINRGLFYWQSMVWIDTTSWILSS